jgi:hypothetical protein
MKASTFAVILLAIAARRIEAQLANTPLSFEVASVKSDESQTGVSRIKIEKGSLIIENVSLKRCIGMAYGVFAGPDWLDSERFDIFAKFPPETAENDVLLMLQSLLADRFNLVFQRHGLTGQVVVMPAEDLEAYQRHVASFTGEYNPNGATEAHLVQALADTSWRLNRVAALESQSKALAILSMHSQRLSRQFERTVSQLRELQKARRTEEKRELDNFLDIIEMYESKGETFDPSAHGFVFSEPQINQSIQARSRERLAEQAYHYHLQSAAA